jgi:3'-5' exoribonuclease
MNAEKLNDLKEEFESLISDYIEDKNLARCCREISSFDEFFEWPASTGFHHAYIGGLFAHIKEVADYAIHKSEAFAKTNRDILATAAIWHDFAKIYDYKKATFYQDQYGEIPKYHVPYEQGKGWKIIFVADEDYKKKIHHVTGSSIEFTLFARANGVDEKTIQEIQHCIIAHHGKPEWGSIKEPRTLEAVILHQADYLSAHFGKTK